MKRDRPARGVPKSGPGKPRAGNGQRGPDDIRHDEGQDAANERLEKRRRSITTAMELTPLTATPLV
jgi:hypothetical protein